MAVYVVEVAVEEAIVFNRVQVFLLLFQVLSALESYRLFCKKVFCLVSEKTNALAEVLPANIDRQLRCRKLCTPIGHS